MRHNDFDDDQLLHAATRYCKVVEEGALEHISNDALQDDHEGGGAVAVMGQANEAAEIPSNSNGSKMHQIFELGVLCR